MFYRTKWDGIISIENDSAKINSFEDWEKEHLVRGYHLCVPGANGCLHVREKLWQSRFSKMFSFKLSQAEKKYYRQFLRTKVCWWWQILQYCLSNFFSVCFNDEQSNFEVCMQSWIYFSWMFMFPSCFLMFYLYIIQSFPRDVHFCWFFFLKRIV